MAPSPPQGRYTRNAVWMAIQLRWRSESCLIARART